jgi:5-formyltetrahydrofolate cyclo-ligase
MDGEIDIRPLLCDLHTTGHPVVLPVTPERGLPLTFRVWHPGEAMVREKFGTFAPSGQVLAPDFLLVPLLAFDRACRRLGYGGGYFDRTLPLLPNAFTLGCAFAAQEAPRVPTDDFDVRLNAIATEREIIRAAA